MLLSCNGTVANKPHGFLQTLFYRWCFMVDVRRCVHQASVRCLEPTGWHWQQALNRVNCVSQENHMPGYTETILYTTHKGITSTVSDTMASSALPLSPDDVPKALRDAVIKARRAWLRKTEVADILNACIQLKLPVRLSSQHLAIVHVCRTASARCSSTRSTTAQLSTEAPQLPASGSLFMFSRRDVRFFRKDGYTWKKKSDNKTVKEVCSGTVACCNNPSLPQPTRSTKSSKSAPKRRSTAIMHMQRTACSAAATGSSPLKTIS